MNLLAPRILHSRKGGGAKLARLFLRRSKNAWRHVGIGEGPLLALPSNARPLPGARRVRRYFDEMSPSEPRLRRFALEGIP